MFVYFPVLAHECDVKAFLRREQVERSFVFWAVHTETHGGSFSKTSHSGRGLQIFAFSTPENAVAV